MRFPLYVHEHTFSVVSIPQMIANLVCGENWLRTAKGSCILTSTSRENNNGMETVKKRPVYLNLFEIRLPIGGVVSIAHRITGVLLVLLLPAAIYLLALSLESLAGFHKAVSFLTSIPGRSEYSEFGVRRELAAHCKGFVYTHFDIT